MIKVVYISASLLAMTIGTAHAACAVAPEQNPSHLPQIPMDPNDPAYAAAQTLVANSENLSIRFAVQRNDGSCVITKPLHGGGGPCIAKGTDQHVTVRFRKKAHHVFNYGRTVNATRQCTTH